MNEPTKQRKPRSDKGKKRAPYKPVQSLRYEVKLTPDSEPAYFSRYDEIAKYISDNSDNQITKQMLSQIRSVSKYAKLSHTFEIKKIQPVNVPNTNNDTLEH